LAAVTLDAQAAVTEAFHQEWGRVVATLIRVTGDWDLAEECAQDAFEAALRRWPADGVPRSPGAWLSTVARNRALDRLRRKANETIKVQEASELSTPAQPTEIGEEWNEIEDDRLRLIFTCCHPALPFEARIALTLRTLAGLTTAEIAHAFLVPEATMAKRLVRAKHKIADAAIPYRVPPADLLPTRLTGVLAVLYLLFNEGYSAAAGAEPLRESLSAEAIRLSRALVQLLPDEPEAVGLLALLLLQHSRRHARVDAAGELVALEDQDRGSWERGEIDEATRLLEEVLPKRRVGPYQLQAAIAACHADAVNAATTDWVEVAELYKMLATVMPSPVVELNRAVAVAMADGPAAGLALVEALGTASQLHGYHLLHATRADLLRRLDRRTEAAESYGQAMELADSDAERRFFARRLAEVTIDDRD
jgi:RNA polymerase sigma-70 factor, ECF subfamily